MAWTPLDQQVIDIGGSQMSLTFADQLPLAFTHKGDFPKEVAYTTGMAKWVQVEDRSYQTSDEIEIIKATSAAIVSQMPSGTAIIDLGAANSTKYEPYVEQFLAQGKSCIYVALDISYDSLVDQIKRAKEKFLTIQCVGLWGSFKHGDKYFPRITTCRLFLSLGSIFYNGPDSVAKDRCAEFKQHLSPADRLIVGQDGPDGAEAANSHVSYQTPQFTEFFTRYLEGIQDHAGITADVKKAWAFCSMMDNSMHYFQVTALQDMICTKIANFKVVKGTEYRMFPSWKRGPTNIFEITHNEGLAITTLGKAPNSGMRQYLVQAP